MQAKARLWEVCDGVTFICNGAIRTAGLQSARDELRYPGAVLGVPVRGRGSRLHLLHAAENTSDMLDGEPYGRLVLHYANGETRKLEILFGIHGDDWLQDSASRNEPVADPNSKLAWVHRRTGDGTTIRLYHTIWENPLPGLDIAAIDVISPLAEANLLLFGFSINDKPLNLAPSYGPGETLGDASSKPITFTLQDAAGNSVPDAKLTWTAQAPRSQIDFPPFPADAQGEVTIDVPRISIQAIQYRASSPDGSSAAGVLKSDAAGSFPAKLVIKLAPKGSQG